ELARDETKGIRRLASKATSLRVLDVLRRVERQVASTSSCTPGRRKETIWFEIGALRSQTRSSRAAQSARDVTMFEVVKELCEILRCAQDDSVGKMFGLSPPLSQIRFPH